MARGGSDEPVHPRRRADERQAILARLARIEGQVRGLQQMIAKDRYTGEVIQQAAAIKAALREVAVLCFEQQARAGLAETTAGAEVPEGGSETLALNLAQLLDAALPGKTASGRNGARDHAAPSGVKILLDEEPTSVLLVEDDPISAEVLKTGLDQLGCSVTVAGTGEDALALLRRDDCTIDWLLADVVLPGRVDGWTVGDEFRSRNPYGRAVFISAYEQKDLSRKPGGSAFLYKPVRPAEVVDTFRRLEAA